MSNNHESAQVMSFAAGRQRLELDASEIQARGAAQREETEAADTKAASPGTPEDFDRRLLKYGVPTMAAIIGLSIATNLGVFGGHGSKKNTQRAVPVGTPAGVVADWSTPDALARGAQAQFPVLPGEGPAETAERVVPQLNSSSTLRNNVIARLQTEDPNPRPGDFEHLPQYIVSQNYGGDQPPISSGATQAQNAPDTIKPN